MTTIKELRLRGFKSFAKLTEIPLATGYNCVIGANGAGKSNVSDAICFALGKISAKSLRAEKSANLIFHGGKKGNPAKEAQVDVTFDNSNSSFPLKTNEIKITRLLKQSGNSVYKINDDVVTRQQVVDLLSAAKIDPDGHNIILQGDIIHFMEMKTEERRQLIEEISGISVYEDKKQKAMNELEKVDAKLNEATIILTERETYMRELKKERDQAEKYKGLETNIKSNKATYLHLQIKEKDEKKIEIEKRLKEQEQERTRHENEINEVKSLIGSKKQELASINKEIESKGEVEQKKIQAEIETLKIGQVKNSTRLDTCNAELKKIELRKKQLEKSIADINKSIDELKQKKTGLEREIRSLSNEEARANENIKTFKEKHNIQEGLVKNIDEIDSAIEKCQAETNSINNAKQEKQRELDRVKFELDGIKLSENKENANEIKDLRNNFKNATTELGKALNDSSFTESQIAKTRKTIIELDEKVAKLNIQNIGAKEFSSFDIAIKKVLDLSEKGVIGTVASIGRIQSKYASALNVAAGQRIKSIVVDNDATATKCINYLKQNRLGVVTFLPLNKLALRPMPNEAQQILSRPGVIGMAASLIEYDKKYKQVFDYVFGHTVVVDEIETARKMGIGRARMVTLDGDLMETSGAMIGGFRHKTLGFKEKDLDSDIKEMETSLDKNKKVLDVLENNLDELDARIKELRNKKALLEADLLKFEKAYGVSDMDALKEKQDSLLEKEKILNKELKAHDNNMSSLNAEMNKLKLARSKVKEKAASTETSNMLSKLEDERNGIKDRMLALKSEISSIDVQINAIFSQEREKTLSIIAGLEKEYNEFSNESSTLTKLLGEQKIGLKEKEASQKRFYSDYDGLFNKRKKIEEEMDKKELAIVKNEERIKSLQQRINSIEIDRAKVVAEMAGLEKEFEPFKDEKIRRGISLQELKDEISKFESMLKNLGSVNMRALEIYNEAEVEYNKILEKTATLKLEKDDVLKLMYEIESKKKDMFMKTFKVISKNFRDIFSNLSTKGEGYIEIENEEDLFNSGVEIKVKITGSKYMDIKGLSGGEKSMAALAFIFAIQECSPASFYLLDEVDAALDKANSDLLSKLIKKYSSKAQYIVISHNDQVITEADTIYGISMQESISKVVSLKI